MTRVERITVGISSRKRKIIEKLVEEGYYNSLNEFVLIAIDNYLREVLKVYRIDGSPNH